MLTELDENQQTIIENLGGVRNVVDALSENVSGLREGLQQAAEEREAGFAQAEEDRIRIEQQTEERFEEATQERIEMYQGLLGRLDEFRRGAEVDRPKPNYGCCWVNGRKTTHNKPEDAEEFNALLADQGG